ncbi:DUF4333 domain-containing protein [Streptomyces griseus]|uniref:DUF4333 domain-containing protein n=1 Tax=Streptomyces griseus TaxID=1911 RepID=UPI00055BF595|nr:DUF4333 domain-containing protein [Streptomyces griseus]
MQPSRFVVGAVGGATAMVALGALATHLIAGTESTTELNKLSTVSVGGHRALAPNIVAGRTESKYHPLPWVGPKVHDVTCPTGLKAVAGATITCTGQKSDGTAIRIGVTTVKATASSITWKFDR